MQKKNIFDFDTLVSRVGTHAEKYTALSRLFGRKDILPFWVADMELPVAPPIVEALAQRVKHPVYGYTSIPDSLTEAIVAWNANRFSLSLGSDDITLIPGVMSGISALISSLSKPGDSIIVQPPLYPPLMTTVLKNGRQLVENLLIVRNGKYQIDFDELEFLLQKHQPRIFLLCSPHNPVGRVWSRAELNRLIQLIRMYNVYLVSDEIHADIVFPGVSHFSALSLTPQANDHIVVLNSASKSFNIAGLNTAYCLITDKKLRITFRKQLRRMNLHGANLFGMVALEAAYKYGHQWLDALLLYLDSNRKIMADCLETELPGVHYFVPEGTYLYWLDFNHLGLDSGQIREKLIDVARVGLNDGITFSRTAEGFWRFNFAVPGSMLEKGLERIVEAFT